MISLGPENSTTPFTIKTYYKIYNFNLYIEYPHAVTFRYLRPFPVFALLRPRIYSRPAPKRIHSFDTTYVQYFTRIFRENPFFLSVLNIKNTNYFTTGRPNEPLRPPPNELTTKRTDKTCVTSSSEYL